MQAMFNMGIASINMNTGNYMMTSEKPEYPPDGVGVYCLDTQKNIIWFQTMFGGLIGAYTNNSGGVVDFIVNPDYTLADATVLSMSFIESQGLCMMTHSNGCIGYIDTNNVYNGCGCINWQGKPDGPSIYVIENNMYYIGWMIPGPTPTYDQFGWIPFNLSDGGGMSGFVPRVPYLGLAPIPAKPGLYIGYQSSIRNSMYMWTVTFPGGGNPDAIVDDSIEESPYEGSQNALVIWDPIGNTTTLVKKLSADEIVIRAGFLTYNNTFYYVSSFANKDPCYLNRVNLMTYENSPVKICESNMACVTFLWLSIERYVL